MRVVEDIRRQIHDGTLPPGALIPSRAQLTRKYQVGETAARHALRVLASEGLIIGRIGSGHYVRERSELTPLHRWRFLDRPTPFAADLQSQGWRVTWDWHSELSRSRPRPRQTAAGRRIDDRDAHPLRLPRRRLSRCNWRRRTSHWSSRPTRRRSGAAWSRGCTRTA
ncbi:GntR family transcriptional regulator [Nonomuraea ferruginea]